MVGYGLRSITVKGKMSDQYSWSRALLSLVLGQGTLTDCWTSHIDGDVDSRCHIKYKQKRPAALVLQRIVLGKLYDQHTHALAFIAATMQILMNVLIKQKGN